jgi:hypothetical protein
MGEDNRRFAQARRHQTMSTISRQAMDFMLGAWIVITNDCPHPPALHLLYRAMSTIIRMGLPSLPQWRFACVAVQGDEDRVRLRPRSYCLLVPPHYGPKCCTGNFFGHGTNLFALSVRDWLCRWDFSENMRLKLKLVKSTYLALRYSIIRYVY